VVVVAYRPNTVVCCWFCCMGEESHASARAHPASDCLRLTGVLKSDQKSLLYSIHQGCNCNQIIGWLMKGTKQRRQRYRGVENAECLLPSRLGISGASS